MRAKRGLLGLLGLLLAAAGSPSVEAVDWAPIEPVERNLRSSLVEKGAPAEILFWEIQTEDSERTCATSHYVRMKVFRAEARERLAKVEIPCLAGEDVVDVAARAYRPDGSVADLDEKAVFSRTLVRAGGLRIRVKTFVLPAVEPGTIVDYRWTKRQPFGLVRTIEVQTGAPVQRLELNVKPLVRPGLSLMMVGFHATLGPCRWDPSGTCRRTLRDVPSFHEEPDRPPDPWVISTVLAFYIPTEVHPGDVWKEVSNQVFTLQKQQMKVTSAIRRAAAEAVRDAATADEKLRRLFAFCRARARDLDKVRPAPSEKLRRRIERIDRAADTLDEGLGTPAQIRALFGALAQAAGFDARLALSADRGMVFDPRLTVPGVLPRELVAIRRDTGWTFLDPGLEEAPYGLLAWQGEGQDVLIAGDGSPVFDTTPRSTASDSRRERKATLSLSEDGTLEGQVRLACTGHDALSFRLELETGSPAELERSLGEDLRRLFPSAEVSNARAEAWADPTRPLVISFDVRVPGFANRVGTRLLLTPSCFEANRPPRFTAPKREHPIWFAYPWTVEDDVTIALPAGFAVEQTLDGAASGSADPDGRHSPNAAASGITAAPLEGDLASYTSSLALEGRSIRFRRSFSWKKTELQADAYAEVKGIWEGVRERDTRQIALRLEGARPAP